MDSIVRKRYLQDLLTLKDKNLIKVITGARRVGKSTLMLQFQRLLADKDAATPICYLNLDVPEYRFLAEKNWQEVYDFITKLLVPNKTNYVFLDEIQNVLEFEKLLEGLFINPFVDLYVTGSNAYLLSSELATLLTGRAYEINVLPFSFAEYLERIGFTSDPYRAFENYLIVGGFPDAVQLANAGQEYAFQYLKTVFEDIFENDISKRQKIYSEKAYKDVVNFLIDTVGSEVSANSIAKNLKQHGIKIDSKSVSKYITTLVDSYLFYKANRYDVKGKQLLATLEKYYSVDIGFRGALIGNELSQNRGHLLENIIYLELLRRGYQVWIGKVDSLEVDFVARNPAGYTQYFQVAATVQEVKTLERELKPFDKIGDHNEKLLLTLDHEAGSRNGIKQLNIVDWLLAM